MKVINLYGGPGSGKSTTAAGLFYKMKMDHRSVELVTEYAKDLVHSDRLEGLLDQQEYIFAKQNNRLHRLRDKYDWVITDSPILLSTVYVNEQWQCVQKFRELVRCTYHTYDNIDLFLLRPEAFQEEGRMQDLQQSKELDDSILPMIDAENDNTWRFVVQPDVVDNILEYLEENHGY